MGKRKNKSDHKQRSATQKKSSTRSPPQAKSPSSPISSDYGNHSSDSGLSPASAIGLSESGHKERDALKPKSNTGSPLRSKSLSSSTSAISDHQADESALLILGKLNVSKAAAVPGSLEQCDTVQPFAAATGLDHIIDRCSDIDKSPLKQVSGQLPSPPLSVVDIDDTYLQASDSSAGKREPRLDKKKRDNDLCCKAGWTHLQWPLGAYHPAWKQMAKQHIIRRICAAIGKIPFEQVGIKRIVPSHPLYTDYDIQGFQESDRRRLVFRVYLPITPRMQTLSVVATMRYVREHTSLDVEVPEVVSFCADATKTDLKFEYVLMRYPPGITVDEALPDSTERQRKQFATEYGEMCIRCEDDPAFYFDKIGSLYQSEVRELEFDSCEVDHQSPSSFFVGYMVAEWFTHDKLAYMSRPGNEFEINAGPFDSAFDLQVAILDCYQKRLTKGLELGFGEDFEWLDEGLLKDKAKLLRGCRNSLKKLKRRKAKYTQTEDTRKGFFLEKSSRTFQDILVDPVTLKITGLINWEETTTVARFMRWSISGDITLLTKCSWFYSRDGEPPYMKFEERDQYLEEICEDLDQALAKRPRHAELEVQLHHFWNEISLLLL